MTKQDRAQRGEDRRWSEWLRNRGDTATTIDGDDDWNTAVREAATDAVRASRRGRR